MQPPSANEITARNWSRGDEPIPGHRLIARLGGGGGGEVWKAQSAGGFTVALKLVPLVAKMGAAELRSLEVLKSIRHPNLLAIFGAWQQQNHLIIAMELADKTLHDRHREEVSQGRPGIPRAELLEYIQEAAKGIDYLNNPGHSVGGREKVSVQHRDIKPQNILLLGNGVKVADFGLAKVLENKVTSNTGAITIAYAAPEFLQGLTSHRSDQYSLAASYCFLRTGRTPYSGNLGQIYTAQLSQSPDLSMLPASERPILRRALALNPEDRWPSCRAFVSELLAVGPDSTAELAVSPSAAKPAPAHFLLSEKPPSAGNAIPADTGAAEDFATVSSTARPQPIPDALSSPQPGTRRASDSRRTARAQQSPRRDTLAPASSALWGGLAGWWRTNRVLVIVFVLTVLAALVSLIIFDRVQEKPPAKPPKEPPAKTQPNDDDLDEVRIDDPARSPLQLPSWQMSSVALGLWGVAPLPEQRAPDRAAAVWTHRT
jgi:serine/threonine protein kinase